MCNFFCLLAILVTNTGQAFFPPGDYPGVTWSLAGSPSPYSDASGVFIFSAEPSSSVGCTNPRFAADWTTGVPLAVYCKDGSGHYFLLATG